MGNFPLGAREGLRYQKTVQSGGHVEIGPGRPPKLRNFAWSGVGCVQGIGVMSFPTPQALTSELYPTKGVCECVQYSGHDAFLDVSCAENKRCRCGCKYEN